MTSIAVVGADGFVGSALMRALSRRAGLVVTGVTRSSYEEARGERFDVLINSAMPAARLWAKTHPHDDFVETVKKTADLVYDWQYEKFVQVSSVSARSQLDTVYGRHKAAAEQLCPPSSLVARLGPLYGQGLKKGVLIDMLQGHVVYVDGDSRYAFVAVDFVAEWIASNLERTGVFDVMARTGIRLRDVATYIGSRVRFDGVPDHQEPEHPEQGLPEVGQVLAFLDTYRVSRLP